MIGERRVQKHVSCNRIDAEGHMMSCAVVTATNIGRCPGCNGDGTRWIDDTVGLNLLYAALFANGMLIDREEQL